MVCEKNKEMLLDSVLESIENDVCKMCEDVDFESDIVDRFASVEKEYFPSGYNFELEDISESSVLVCVNYDELVDKYREMIESFVFEIAKSKYGRIESGIDISYKDVKELVTSSIEDITNACYDSRPFISEKKVNEIIWSKESSFERE